MLNAKKLVLLNCVLEKTLETPLGCKEIKLVNPRKKINTEYLLEGLMLNLKPQYFGYLIWRTNSLKKKLMLGKTEGKRKRGQQRMRRLVGIIDSMDMDLSKLFEIMEDRGACHVAGPGVAKSQTQLSNWTTITNKQKCLDTPKLKWSYVFHFRCSHWLFYAAI